MAVKTFDEFADQFFTGDERVIEVSASTDKRKHLVVKHGRYTAVLYPMSLSDHLCIDIHTFVDGQAARSSVFGMEDGRKLTGYAEADAEGTSHGLPAASLTAVLVGEQTKIDTRIKWRNFNPGTWIANDIHILSKRERSASDAPAGWYLQSSAAGTDRALFMSADLHIAMDRAGALIRAWEESLSGMTIDDLIDPES